MKRELLLVCAGAAAAALGFPSVTDVTVAANETARRVTVGYTLVDAPAIVTVEVLTNGVPLDAAVCSCVYGDVNRLVSSSGAHELTWLADHSGFNARLDDVSVTARVKAWSPETPPDYLAVGVDAPNDVRYFTCEDALPGGIANIDWRTRYILMRKIPAAGVRRRLGCQTGENGVKSANFNTLVRETPRVVTFTNDFWIGVFPVTQGQWCRCWTSSGESWISNPSSFKNRADSDVRPVENMVYTEIRPNTWPSDAHVFSDRTWIGRLRELTGVAFDLPTDAQWEFACRAGCDTALYNGKGVGIPEGYDPELDKLGWFTANAGNETHPVGQKQPNAWGLYDMLGNVWEIVLDRAGDGSTSISGDETVEPQGGGSLDARCRRGGSWMSTARMCRCGMRGSEGSAFKRSDSGFRLMAPVGLVW